MQELSMNVLDIAQNSVRAEASAITITVNENALSDSLTITIADNGRGMAKEQLNRVTDPFHTTRTTRKVGLGIPFFKMAAEMTGGSLRIESCVGKGTVITATFVLSHIDRMPLGDMPQTITQLICLNESINITYAYSLNGNEFTVSSREFIETLEGIPLNNPSVMHFINSYITENSNALMDMDRQNI